MDPQQPDNGSERTLPSQHGQMISNLSTRPNISEQNDPIFDDVPNQQRPFDIHTDRQNNYPTFSQRIINHRSQSFDQGISPLPAHFSAPPHLNQHRLQQQGRENMPIINNATNGKAFQLTTFDEDWERNLKEEEDNREKEYENHVLFNQENEPLLSQKHEIDHYDAVNHQDIIYSDNEPLLSQTMASDQHFQLPIDNDPLLTQKSEPAYQLNSIHQSNQDGKSEASVSNQVKFVQHEITNQYFNLDSGQKSQKSHHSSSAIGFTQQPLFQIEFKDDTQSNLLKFGFTVKKKETNPKEQSQNHQVNQIQSNNEIHFNEIIVKQEEPMHIEQNSYFPVPQHKQEQIIFDPQPEHRQEQNSCYPEPLRKGEQSNYFVQPQPSPQPQPGPKEEQSNSLHQDNPQITIQVNDCHSENINSASKNNDIYGITEQSAHQQISNADEEWENNDPKIELREQQQDNNEPPKQVQWTYQEGKSIKFDQVEEQCKEQVQNILQQPKDSINLQKQRQQISLDNQSLQQERPLTLEEIKEQMSQIANGGQGVQQTQRGVKLLRQHIDFLFIIPLSDIGRQIMADGNTVVSLIKIILLKESDNSLKEILRKYLVLTLASKVSRNQQDLIDYQQATIIHKPHSASIENKHQNIQVVINQSVIQLDATSKDPINHSVHAENGSSGRKSINEKMEVDGQRQPVKRTVKNKNLVVESEKPSLRSGKVTRKTKYKSKGKGKTTSKKSTVKFEQQSNDESEIAPLYEQPKSIIQEKQENPDQIKKGFKSIQRVVADSIKKGVEIDTYNKNLGTKFTYILLESNQGLKKEIVQRRVSQRLAGRASNSKEKTSISTQKDQRKLRSHSSKKKSEEHQDEQLSLDYIKLNFRQIKFKLLPQQYLPLTPTDQEIDDFVKKLLDEKNDEESRENSTQHNEDYNNVEPDDNTVSARSQTQTNSMIRMEEFKKNLSKYKVSEIPIVILRVVDPDINEHGIYALLELGKLSQIVHNARFALIAITSLSRASKKLIEEDLSQARRQAGDEKNNLVFLQPTATILDLVKSEKERRVAQQ